MSTPAISHFLVPFHPRMSLPGPAHLARLPGKALDLLLLSHWGLPVPPGFILRDDAPPLLARGLFFLSKLTGLTLGNARRPLVLAVRSGDSARPAGSASAIFHIGRDAQQHPHLALQAAVEFHLAAARAALPAPQSHPSSTPHIPAPCVIVQLMVGDGSGFGQACTRHPQTGVDRITGRFTPPGRATDSLPPAVIKKLAPFKKKLEKHTGQVRQISFILDRGGIFLLGSRPARLSPQALVRSTVELAQQRLLPPAAALLRIAPSDLNAVTTLHFDPAARLAATPLAQGMPVSPGAAAGHPAVGAAQALALLQSGKSVILVCPDLSAEDLALLPRCAGLLATSGSTASHAAIMARNLGLPAIVGLPQLQVDLEQQTLRLQGQSLTSDQVLSVDGSTGAIYLGALPLNKPSLPSQARQLLSWADRTRRLKVEAEVDSPAQAALAVALGAEGVGLCRLDRLLQNPARLLLLQKLLLADSPAPRQDAINLLLPLLRDDVLSLLRTFPRQTVVLRLLDTPLHEFLPVGMNPRQLTDFAQSLQLPVELVRQRLAQLRTAHPMLGLRGSRLLLTHPELLQLQIAAIGQAWLIAASTKNSGRPAILLPLLSSENEFSALRAKISGLLDPMRFAFRAGKNASALPLPPIGAMIETPRAALLAERFARQTDFLCFGGNDLTQSVFALSRDDAHSFLPAYLRRRHFPADPFQTLDVEGVGKLILQAVQQARRVKPRIKCVLCGRQAEEPTGVDFAHSAQLDAVVCAPPSIPLVRLAAAQASLRQSR